MSEVEHILAAQNKLGGRSHLELRGAGTVLG